MIVTSSWINTYHYETFLFISGKTLFLHVYLIWYQYDNCILPVLPVSVAHLFPSFTFNLFESLYLKCISYRQHMVGSCFIIHSDNLCLFTRVFRQLILNVIIVMVRCGFTILCFFSVYSLCFLYLFFLSCLVLDYVNIYFFIKFFFFFNFYLFIYGCVGSSFLCEGFLQLRQAGATLHRGARASHCRGPSRCGAQAPDAQAQQLWLTGLVAPRHVGSSQTRARTRVPCIGRRTLNHCATREAPMLIFLEFHFNLSIGFLALPLSNFYCDYKVHYNIFIVYLKFYNF